MRTHLRVRVDNMKKCHVEIMIVLTEFYILNDGMETPVFLLPCYLGCLWLLCITMFYMIYEDNL